MSPLLNHDLLCVHSQTQSLHVKARPDPDAYQRACFTTALGPRGNLVIVGCDLSEHEGKRSYRRGSKSSRSSLEELAVNICWPNAYTQYCLSAVHLEVVVEEHLHDTTDEKNNG